MQYGVTEYPNTFKRQADFPLDESTLYPSLTAANEYIHAENTTAYGGQIISVKNSLTGVYDIYVVQESENGYRLASIVPTVFQYLRYNIGTYCLYKRVSNLTVEFAVDINYPLKASYYSVYLLDENDNETIIQDNNNNSKFEVGHSFITASQLFETNNTFTIRLLDESNNELIKLYSKNIDSIDSILDTNISFGTLSLLK